MLRMLLQLCDRLQCYMAIRSPSPSITAALTLSLCCFIFLCWDFSNSLAAWWLSSLSQLSLISSFSSAFFSFSPTVLCPTLSVLLSSRSSTFLCHFLAATSSPFFNSRHSLCSPVSLLFILCAKHFAPLMFQRAGTLTGDMEVHLCRQEQPGGINRNQWIHNMGGV